MLDGYVTAIVAGPVPFDPREWICPLLAIDADALNRGGTPEFAGDLWCATMTSQHPLDSVRSVRAHRPA
jgi:uncharacterized protein